MVTNYFTFGMGQKHPSDNTEFDVMGRRAVKITGKTNSDCRAAMVKMFGIKWGFQYSEEDYFASKYISDYIIYLDITLN